MARQSPSNIPLRVATNRIDNRCDTMKICPKNVRNVKLCVIASP